MKLSEARDQVAQRLVDIPEVRRVYAKLEQPPRIRIDLVSTATPLDDEAVRIALASLDVDLPVDIIHSGKERITVDNTAK